MSILTVETSSSKSGIKKTIDKDSNDVALDILQRGIYAHPVQSTVRELASNAYDANIERNMAVAILNGSDKVEDHYDVTKVDGIYHASGWDPDYYNIKHLSDDQNIYLLYEEGVQKDILRIKDNGIGLGGSRLIGYFQLAYSSKRTQKGVNGRWGLGNKSALSLGIDSYTVINRYNGRKFRFEVYLDNVISTTPKFSNGKKNDFITVSVPQPATDDAGNATSVDKDFIFYYEETDETNGLEVIVPVKKHEKKEFFRAVEEQLMYIPDVVFKYKKVGGIGYETINIAAEIIYRDSNIIMSKSTVLDKPHILLGAGKGLINYGLVDFQALELEPKRGAVGLILDINDVEVTPSRESVIWSPKTRAAVIKSYNEIVNTATKLINNELTSAIDYWDWIKKAGSIRNALVNGSSAGDTVLQKLSGVVDPHSINKIYYRKNGMNKLFSSSVKEVIGEKLLVRVYEYDRWGKKMNRTKVKSVNTVAGLDTYITDGASDKYKDRYIFEHISNGKFIVIKRLEGWEVPKTSNLIGNSSLITSYDSIQVPDDILANYQSEDLNPDGTLKEDADVTIDPNRLAKLRKLHDKILYHEARVDNSAIVYSSIEIKVNELSTKFAKSDIIYGTFNDRTTIDQVVEIMPYGLFQSINSYRLSYNIDSPHFLTMYDNILKTKAITPVNAVLISKENTKHIKDNPNFTHISDFIIESYKNNCIVFNKTIRFAVTMDYLNNILSSHNINFHNRGLYEETEVKDFYGEEFINIKLLSKMSESRPSTYVSTFFNNCINYEISKKDSDQSVLQQYLNEIDRTLPDVLCDEIDKIEDVHIIDTDLIEQTIKYCEFFKEFNPILKEVTYESDVDIIQVLSTLVKDYAKKPKELGYFH